MGWFHADLLYKLEGDYTYYPLPYAGIGLALQYSRDFDGDEYTPNVTVNGKEYGGGGDTLHLEQFFVIPQLSFRTPTVLLSRKHDIYAFLQCSPGLMIALFPNASYYARHVNPDPDPRKWTADDVRVHNHGGDRFFWRLRTQLCLGNSDGYLFLGYCLSNYDPYGDRRNLQVDHHPVATHFGQSLYNRVLQHTLFIGATYCF